MHIQNAWLFIIYIRKKKHKLVKYYNNLFPEMLLVFHALLSILVEFSPGLQKPVQNQCKSVTNLTGMTVRSIRKSNN